MTAWRDATRRPIVILSEAMDLVGAGEILRFAQDDSFPMDNAG